MKQSLKIAFGMAMISTVVACTLISREARAEGSQDTTAQSTTTVSPSSDRVNKRFGIYVGILNEPSPSILSLNVGYNLKDYVRIVGGVGRLSVSGVSFDGSPAPEASATTIGVGAKFMVPGWNLTPTFGVNTAAVIYSGTPGMISVGGFDQSGINVYVSGGLDYQSPAGFNVGVGVNESLRPGIGASGYLNAGWFFDWLG